MMDVILKLHGEPALPGIRRDELLPGRFYRDGDGDVFLAVCVPYGAPEGEVSLLWVGYGDGKTNPCVSLFDHAAGTIGFTEATDVVSVTFAVEGEA